MQEFSQWGKWIKAREGERDLGEKTFSRLSTKDKIALI
jgi:hypothetical protein